MAYSQTQLEALEAALASGMLRVSFEGRSVEYRSVEELKKAIAEVKAAMAAADPARPRSRVIRTYTRKGF
jgi:roadblock/LC7 domain-containing protein